jgi:hypothetical protein
MHSIVFMLTLTMVGGAAVTVPIVGNSNNRAILYWLVLPALAIGAAAMLSRLAGF